MKHLIGKNILEVIVELSKREFVHKDSFFVDCEYKVKITDFHFVFFDEKRKRDCGYFSLPNKEGVSMESLNFVNREDRGSGLISLVGAQKVDPKEFPYNKKSVIAHLPFIDIDLDKAGLRYGTESLDLVKKLIKEHLQIKEGILLRSSLRNNLHFIGTDRLLSRDNFIKFLGLCLTMGYQKEGEQRYTNVADYRHIGHSLTPTSPLPELTELGYSKYGYTDVFATLSVKHKNSQDGYSNVIDVL